MKDYKELIIWQKSIELVEIIYALTKKFPKEELFGITNQMRRSVISIPSNIENDHKENDDIMHSFYLLQEGLLQNLKHKLLYHIN